MEEIKTTQQQVEETLAKAIQGTKLVYSVKDGKNFFGGQYLMIWICCSNKDMNVVGQKPQVVSLCLNIPELELYPQVFGGNGGNSIFRKPNLEDPTEKYLAMKRIKIPFRKPQPQIDKVLITIQKFVKNYIDLLRANIDVLMYQNEVDYNDVLGTESIKESVNEEYNYKWGTWKARIWKSSILGINWSVESTGGEGDMYNFRKHIDLEYDTFKEAEEDMFNTIQERIGHTPKKQLS